MCAVSAITTMALWQLNRTSCAHCGGYIVPITGRVHCSHDYLYMTPILLLWYFRVFKWKNVIKIFRCVVFSVTNDLLYSREKSFILIYFEAFFSQINFLTPYILILHIGHNEKYSCFQKCGWQKNFTRAAAIFF